MVDSSVVAMTPAGQELEDLLPGATVSTVRAAWPRAAEARLRRRRDPHTRDATTLPPVALVGRARLRPREQSNGDWSGNTKPFPARPLRGEQRGVAIDPIGKHQRGRLMVLLEQLGEHALPEPVPAVGGYLW
jgi:hypothetical protein